LVEILFIYFCFLKLSTTSPVMISVGIGSLALARDYLAKGEGKRSPFHGCA
jgi:hypothetical protein